MNTKAMVFSNSGGRAIVFGSYPGQFGALGRCHLAQGVVLWDIKTVNYVEIVLF